MFQVVSWAADIPARESSTNYRNPPATNVLGSAIQPREVPMLYAILAYHVEAEVMSWSPEEDAALMS